MWRSKQKPICLKRKREDDDNDEKLNSSFQVPNYARITNARVKAGNKTHLLTLPETLRHRIFRMAIVEPEPILISTHNTEAGEEPGLLSVSHDVREEALRIFYVENDFDLVVHDFDAAALLPWLEKTSMHRSKAAAETAKGEKDVKQEIDQARLQWESAGPGAFDLSTLSPNQTWLLEKQHIYNSARNIIDTPGAGGICWSILFQPDWRNLVAWLKLFHAGKLLGPPKDDEGTAAEKAAFAVFDVVQGLKGEKWTMVAKVLPGLRMMLGAGEPEWMEGSDVEDGNGDGMAMKREGLN